MTDPSLYAEADRLRGVKKNNPPPSRCGPLSLESSLGSGRGGEVGSVAGARQPCGGLEAGEPICVVEQDEVDLAEPTLHLRTQASL